MPTSRKTTVCPASAAWVSGSIRGAPAEGDDASLLTQGPARPGARLEGWPPASDEDVGAMVRLRLLDGSVRVVAIWCRVPASAAPTVVPLLPGGADEDDPRVPPYSGPHRDGGKVCRVVAGRLGHRVAELLQGRPCEHERDHGLRSVTTPPPAPRRRRSVGGWPGRLEAMSTVSRLGTVDRFHRGADAQHSPTLMPPRSSGTTTATTNGPVGVKNPSVVGLAASAGGGAEVTDPPPP